MTDKPSYVCALEDIRKDIVKIIKERQGESFVGVGLPSRESTQSLKMRNTLLVMLEFEPAKKKRFLWSLGVKCRAANSTLGRLASAT